MAGYVLAYDYPVLGAFWTMLFIFLWVIWLMLLFRVVVDLFRDRDMSGWAKAGWLFFVLVLPYLGVFVYLVARGREMAYREVDHARAQREQVDAYIRETAAGAGTDTLSRLAELKASGDLSEAEYRRAKEKVLR